MSPSVKMTGLAPFMPQEGGGGPARIIAQPALERYYGYPFLVELQKIIDGQSSGLKAQWDNDQLAIQLPRDASTRLDTIRVWLNQAMTHAFVTSFDLGPVDSAQLLDTPIVIQQGDKKIAIPIYQSQGELPIDGKQTVFDLRVTLSPDYFKETNPANDVLRLLISYLSTRLGHSFVDTTKDQKDWSPNALVNTFWRLRPNMSERYVKFVPIVESPLLASLLGASSVIITDQSVQHQHSFKPLGAHNFLIFNIERGYDPLHTAIVAASHGNHAQGVVLAATNLSFKETLLSLPLHEQTSKVKIRACLKKGALIMLHGNNLFQAMERAKLVPLSSLADILRSESVVYLPGNASEQQINEAINRGLTVLMFGDPDLTETQSPDQLRQRFESFSQKTLFVPTYDHPQIAMGQGLDMMDLVARVPSLLQGVWSYAFPMGGMGKGAGDGSVIGSLNPAVDLVGVSSVLVPAAYRSLQAGRLILNTEELNAPEGGRPKYADGTDVPDIGQATFEQYHKLGGRNVLVTEDEIGEALVFAATQPWYQGQSKIIEGAPASAIAALLNGAVQFVHPRIVLSVTGDNIDESILNRAFENHGWIQESPELYRRVTEFRRFLRLRPHEESKASVDQINELLQKPEYRAELKVLSVSPRQEDLFEKLMGDLQVDNGPNVYDPLRLGMAGGIMPVPSFNFMSLPGAIPAVF